MGTDGTELNNGEQTPTGKRKSKKVMSDGSISWDNQDDKAEGNRIKFLEDLKNNKIKSEKYSNDMVKRLSGHEVTVAHMQREGFNNPIFVPEKEGLGNMITMTYSRLDQVLKDGSLNSDFHVISHLIF